MKSLELRKSVITTLIACLLGLAITPAAEAADEAASPTPPPVPTLRSITFPVKGPVRFTNDFGAPRAGHTHQGNDIFASKMQPLLAAADGTVVYLTAPARPQPSSETSPTPTPTATPVATSSGYAVFIRGADGFTYRYIHLNNDTPGTDDGAASFEQVFTPEISLGAKVTKGQHIAYVGDSGNAEDTASHLHFEIRLPDSSPMNPFDSLSAAPHEKQAQPAKTAKASCKKNGKKTVCAKAKRSTKKVTAKRPVAKKAPARKR